MKLAACPDCMNPCSPAASVCPKCGRPFKEGDLLAQTDQRADSKRKKFPVKTLILYSLIVAVIAQLPLTVKWLQPDVKEALKTGEQSGDQPLGIENIIRKVRNELTQSAKSRTPGEAALFRVKTFDLEIHFVVKASTSANEGVEFQVVSANSTSQTDLEKVQKITLHLEAIPEREVVQGPPKNNPILATPDEVVTEGELPPPGKRNKK